MTDYSSPAAAYFSLNLLGRTLRDISERHRGSDCSKSASDANEPPVDTPIDPASLHLQLWPQIPMPHPNSVPTGEWMEPVEPDVTEPRSFLLDVPSEPVTGMAEVPSDCRWVKIDDFPADKLTTSVRCKGGDGNRSCFYENLFFNEDGFVAVQAASTPLPPSDDIRVNIMGKFGSYFWKPEIVTATDTAEARTIVKHTKEGWMPDAQHIVACPYTTLHFETMFSQNPGWWRFLAAGLTFRVTRSKACFHAKCWPLLLWAYQLTLPHLC